MCGAGWRYPPLSTSPLTWVTARGVQESQWGLTCEFWWNPRLPFESGVAEFSDSGVTLRCPCTAWSEVWALHCADLSYMNHRGCWLLTRTPFHRGCRRMRCSLNPNLWVMCTCANVPQKLQHSRTNIQAEVKYKRTCRLPKLRWVRSLTHTYTHTHSEVNRARQEGKLKRPNEINLRQYTLELQRFPRAKRAFP